MKILGEKHFELNDNHYDLKIYPKFMDVTVHVSVDWFAELVKRLGPGQFDQERLEISIYVDNLFKNKPKNLKRFSSMDDYYKFMNNYGIEVQHHNNNQWFKKAAFILNQNSFEEDLDQAIEYVKDCAKRSKERKDKKSIVGKLLKRKF